MIPDERVEKALEYIRDNAKRGGQLAGAVKESEARIKAQKAIGFLSATGTVDERKSHAEGSTEVRRAIKDYVDSVSAYETCKIEMKAAELLIAVYQTESANNRKGVF